MRFSTVWTAFAITIAFSMSCSKEKEVVTETNCRFIGSSYRNERNGTYLSSVETYESHLKQDEQGKLTFISVSRASSYQDEKNPIGNFTEDESYNFKYNAEGFLIELNQHKLILQNGTAKFDYGYANYGRYRKGQQEITNLTTYTYQGGLAHSSTTVNTMVVQGDDRAARTYIDEVTTTYQYNPQGVVQTATTSTETGGGKVITFQNGIRATETSSNGSVTLKYDEKGRITSFKYSNGEQTFKYDDRGNQVLHEGYVNGQSNFSEKRIFDNQKNPDNLIPYRYKGIPEDLKILNFNENENNIVETTYQVSGSEPVVNTWIWAYKPNDLPETSTLIKKTNEEENKWVTKYNYENCD